jgi:pimeloyl-ACP methyl ester carboxylesterase
MRFSIALILLLMISSNEITAQTKTLYLLSGQGSDERIYQEINWDTNQYQTVYIPYLIPERGEAMNTYAQRLAQKIDTTKPYTIIGVSLGGMLASEMKTFLNPEKVIIISSAKCRSELPTRYRMQRYLPFYALVPKEVLKAGALIAQPLFEPDRKSHKEIFVSMLKSKDKRFTKRSIRMIMNWDKDDCDPELVHIHGEADNTLPINKVKPTHIVEKGSHMMALTRAKDVSAIINEVLNH